MSGERPHSTSPTAGELLAEARRELEQSTTEADSREAALLLSRVTRSTETRLYAFPETPIPIEEAERFRQLVARRSAGEPVAYLLGEREFFGRSFEVDPRVLIPRPETEHLVEAALELALPPSPRIVDLGTGSGAIAVTLGLEIDGATVVAGDLSLGALAVARRNRDALSAPNVHLVASDLASAIDLSTVDLVVSNPPYIAERDLPTLARDVVAFEPRLALTAEHDGLSVLRRLAEILRELRPGTPVLLEIGHDQEEAVGEIFAATLTIAEIRRDYAGHPRSVVGRRS